MIFRETKLKGAYIVELEALEDSRGFFGRTYCRREFETHGLNPAVVQCNISCNKKKGTLRGMHYQAAPFGEAKFVSCMRGAIYDVIIDLRRDSATYCHWFSIELSSLSSSVPPQMLYVPENFAHGFQTLEDDSQVFYQMSEFYEPSAARGVRWNDPTFKIVWPGLDPILSEKDRDLADYLP